MRIPENEYRVKAILDSLPAESPNQYQVRPLAIDKLAALASSDDYDKVKLDEMVEDVMDIMTANLPGLVSGDRMRINGDGFCFLEGEEHRGKVYTLEAIIEGEFDAFTIVESPNYGRYMSAPDTTELQTTPCFVLTKCKYIGRDGAMSEYIPGRLVIPLNSEDLRIDKIVQTRKQS